MNLFKLVGSVFINTDEANKSISKTDTAAYKLGQSIQKAQKTFAIAGATITATSLVVGKALSNLLNKQLDSLDTIDKASQKAGMSTTSYQEWAYVMDRCGMSIDTMVTGTKTFNGVLTNATKGVGSAVRKFHDLGVELYDNNGQLRNQDVLMKETIYSLANMENYSERTRLAIELFGKAGQELAPMLNSGEMGIDDLIAKAHELGLVIDEDTIKKGANLKDSLDDIKASFENIGTSILEDAMPYLQKFADYLTEHLPEIKKQIEDAVDTIEDIGGGFGTAYDKVKTFVEYIFDKETPVGKAIDNWIHPDGTDWKTISDFVEELSDEITALPEKWKKAVDDWNAETKREWDDLVKHFRENPLLSGVGGKVLDWFESRKGVEKGTISDKSSGGRKLAKGGIVNSPISALIGEDGREAVIPLEHNTEWTTKVAAEINAQTNQGLLNLLSEISAKLDDVGMNADIRLNVNDRRLFEIVREQSYMNSRSGGRPISV